MTVPKLCGYLATGQKRFCGFPIICYVSITYCAVEVVESASDDDIVKEGRYDTRCSVGRYCNHFALRIVGIVAWLQIGTWARMRGAG